MVDSNVHPIFEDLLSAIDPSKSSVTTQDKMLQMLEEVIKEKGILLSGYNRLVCAINSPNCTIYDIRTICLDVLDKVGNKQ